MMLEMVPSYLFKNDDHVLQKRRIKNKMGFNCSGLTNYTSYNHIYIAKNPQKDLILILT